MNICIRVTVTVTVHVSVHVFSDLIRQGLINLEPTNVSICLCFFVKILVCLAIYCLFLNMVQLNL